MCCRNRGGAVRFYRHPGLVPGSTWPHAHRSSLYSHACLPLDSRTGAGVTMGVGKRGNTKKKKKKTLPNPSHKREGLEVATEGGA